MTKFVAMCIVVFVMQAFSLWMFFNARSVHDAGMLMVWYMAGQNLAAFGPLIWAGIVGGVRWMRA